MSALLSQRQLLECPAAQTSRYGEQSVLRHSLNHPKRGAVALLPHRQ